MTYSLKCEMRAGVPIAEAFRIFEDPFNLARITPSWLNFRVTSQNVQTRKGAEITYRIAWLGFPISWKTIITEYDPPRLFIDEQAQGPYVLWRHRHDFQETDGGTIISDRVDYILPLGPLGRLAHCLVVKRQLREIFRFRQQAIAKILGGAETSFTEPQITLLR
ncbi:MAG: SRPBCC family protein [Acidobacteriota bacterium]|nr:SRPBCC family protein [Acidobacteriota bacterium]